MKTIKKVTIISVYVETIPDKLEEGKLYISEKHETIVHNCLCGCGIKTVTPLNNIINGKDHGWKLIKNNNGKISLTPSIGNFMWESKYHAHYIITNNVANFV